MSAMRLHSTLAALAPLCIAAACSTPDPGSLPLQRDETTQGQGQAIVAGAVDTTRPDVLLLQDDTAPGFRCTATLIAPNLVVTARHCVGKRAVAGTSTLCQGDATDNGAQSLPDYMGDVAAAPMYFSDAPGGTILARALTVYDDGSTTTCAHDLALIGLDRNIVGITPSEIRRTPVAVGDPLVAMGFGWTDRMATINATQRMSGTTSVLALGPVVYTFKPLGDAASPDNFVAAAGGEIAVQGITMTGDSGGPAFDASGRLAAVVSRGYSDAYYGPGTFTTLAAHLATIDAALAATGNIPDGGVDMLPDAVAPKPDAGGDAGGPDTNPPLDQDAAFGASPTAAAPSSSSGGCSATGAVSGASSAPGSGAGLAAVSLLAAALVERRRRARASSAARCAARSPA
jgi:hypothetical protein